MATTVIQDLEARSQAAWRSLTAQLDGMAPYLERSDEPGEWTARQVLTHQGMPAWMQIGPVVEATLWELLRAPRVAPARSTTV